MIHNIENSPFRTKFDKDVAEMEGNLGIGCISDNEPQPLLVRSHLGNFAITTVGKINNIEALVEKCFNILDLAYCCNCKISQMGTHQKRLRFIVRNTAYSKIRCV